MTAHSRKQGNLEKQQVTIGFIPLTDCAILAVAKEKGFFSSYGLDVALSREASWANIRDKLAYGILDCAQMLATMPITSTLGVGGWKKDTVCSMALGVNGNAITVSEKLYNELKQVEPGFDHQRPVTALTLKQLVKQKKASGEPALNFAHVFPASTHNYFLRYWLASAGINPDHDVNMSVIPPQQMVNNLEANIVDGFCVGEPWNQVAIHNGIGHVLISSYEIWNNVPDKVLGMNKEWAYNHPNTHKAIVKALLEAACWADDMANRDEVAEILSREAYINIPVEVIRAPLTGQYQYHSHDSMETMSDFNVFYKYAATFPWHSHAAWLMSQMQRWGDLPGSIDVKNIIKDIFWVDFYRQVAKEINIDYPISNTKTEGVHSGEWQVDSAKGTISMSSDLFFDNEQFVFD